MFLILRLVQLYVCESCITFSSQKFMNRSKCWGRGEK